MAGSFRSIPVVTGSRVISTQIRRTRAEVTGDVPADYAHMAHVYNGVKGFHTAQAAPVLP